MQSWKYTERELPPRGEVVMTESPGGIQQTLKLHTQEGSGLWFVPDGVMYVYYTPNKWRHLNNGETA